ncbi:malonyl-CoA decarboxylase [Alteromonas sp. 14N.309.X.WAT.G.H12]|uniref:malonyl-CoA decarboxylase n=1 Tax=Alteromonas sp. 14N.309.X.WAT.G.H12 TaxID=3120824 RepID=UPI002FD3719A
MLKWSSLFEDLISRVTEIGETMISSNVNESLIDKCIKLLTSTGEATGLARSREILDGYKALNDEQQLAFFQSMQEQLGVDTEKLKKAVLQWNQNPGDKEARNIHFASEPRTQELIRRLNRASGGTASLVKMRQDLLAHIKTHADLGSVDEDFKHLFNSWFNRGFLTLEVINWSTSADILEKIITYEAVHKIDGWNDLRRRVAEKDRRLYAFFHPALPSEPLIFVEVALMNDVPQTMDEILSPERQRISPFNANMAVFYSISNCQVGLKGISFGNFLIKQVVEELRRELPNLKRFITMSPVPSLCHWANNNNEIAPDMAQTVAQMEDCPPLPSADFKQNMQTKLGHLASYYLLQAKNKHGQPYDPVSRFHLGNGARLEQINFWADTSEKGIKTSWSIMVNYEYDLRSIEQNHEAFVSKGVISTSSTVKKMLPKKRDHHSLIGEKNV